MTKLVGVTTVSIDKLKEVPEYKELLPENNNYEALKQSIQQLGFIDRITVNTNFEILDGYTRYRIAKELQINQIPVEIYETSGKDEELDIIASLNLKRRHLTKDEIVDLIYKIAEKKKSLVKKQNNNEQNATSTYRISGKESEENTIKSESREIKDELSKLAPDIKINEETIRQYLQIKNNAPWLIQYIGDESKGKIGITKAYRIYSMLNKKGLLDLNNRLPKSELDRLITSREYKKILERDDLLQQILDKKMSVSQAISIIKSERKSRRKKEESEQIQEEEEEGDEEEYPLLEEWEKASEDIIEELKSKGFAELPFEVVLLKIDGKCYIMNADALRDLEQGKEGWNELVEFLSEHRIILPGEVEGIYIIPWLSFGRCVEWNSGSGKNKN